jgi:hypothetical protein
MSDLVSRGGHGRHEPREFAEELGVDAPPDAT